ncbi:MAG: universal stress protein [Methanotrichaceae archaeon]|nr:universal stress protein [Methanotrichaceae archaeon]
MFEKILVATDGSKHSEDAADAAMQMAKLCKGKVTALYVIDVGKEFAFSDISANIADEVVLGIRNSLTKKGEAAVKRIEEKAKAAGVDFEGKVIEGEPASDIIKTASDSGMNLIVIGSIGVTGLDKYLLGSVADKVIRGSKVPVMVVR